MRRPRKYVQSFLKNFRHQLELSCAAPVPGKFCGENASRLWIPGQASLPGDTATTWDVLQATLYEFLHIKCAHDQGSPSQIIKLILLRSGLDDGSWGGDIRKGLNIEQGKDVNMGWAIN